MKETLEKEIKAALARVGAPEASFAVDYPPAETGADYACNAAFTAAKMLGKAPKEVAEALCEVLTDAHILHVERIDIAGPGFLNVVLDAAYMQEVVARARTAGDQWGSNTSLSGQKILIEKSAPNLFKPFHIGHLLNISVGESLSRLTRFSGANVIDVAYPSDISLGVAKAVWAIVTRGLKGKLSINVLGESYVYGTQKYDEDEETKRAIIEVNQKLNHQTPSIELDVYKKGYELNLNYFEAITQRLGSSFADYFFESESGAVGKGIVESHVGEVFEKSDGAIVFPGEKYGLHTRVFITSLGLPVYEAKDIGLLKLKFDKYDPDASVVITDVEQKQYFEVIKKAASLINPTWSEHSTYWQHGRMKFAGGNISSRFGNVPLAEDLIEKVKEGVREKMKQGERSSELVDNDALVESIALAALRYSFLRGAAGHNIVFDFEKSLSFEGDSGPYLQYAHTRCLSIARKAAEEGVAASTEARTKEISAPERLLARFPEVAERAAREYAPHHVAQYLTSLASAFNAWYAQTRVLDGTPEAPYKLAVVEAVGRTLKNGLWLLGIDVPQEM
ncbi:MAG TPA: arginine--tRNA ligase [Candidatus Paceibacterota bacterium]